MIGAFNKNSRDSVSRRFWCEDHCLAFGLSDSESAKRVWLHSVLDVAYASLYFGERVREDEYLGTYQISLVNGANLVIQVRLTTERDSDEFDLDINQYSIGKFSFGWIMARALEPNCLIVLRDRGGLASEIERVFLLAKAQPKMVLRLSVCIDLSSIAGRSAVEIWGTEDEARQFGRSLEAKQEPLGYGGFAIRDYSLKVEASAA